MRSPEDKKKLMRKGPELCANEMELIRNANIEIDKIYIGNIAEVTTTLFDSQIPQTGKAILMLVCKMEYISNSIYGLYNNMEIYSVNILYRVLIEHYFKINFIIFKHSELKDDTIGKNYYTFCDLDEILKLAKAYEKIYDQYKIKEKEQDIKKFKMRLAPELFDYSKGKINKEGAKFSYLEIWKYLITRLDTEDDIKSFHLSTLIPEYSRLSSFVHAGPKTDEYINQCVDATHKQNRFLEICKMTYTMNAYAKQLMFIIASDFNEIFLRYYQQIDGYRNGVSQSIQKLEEEYLSSK